MFEKLLSSDVNKDLEIKDQDQDQDQDFGIKDQDKDKDLKAKDQDQDQDFTFKDKDQDKDMYYSKLHFQHKFHSTLTIMVRIHMKSDTSVQSAIILIIAGLLC